MSAIDQVLQITRKSVLLDCLLIMENQLAEISADKLRLMPKEGKETEFEMQQKKIDILRDLIQAYDSELVRQALYNWHKAEGLKL